MNFSIHLSIEIVSLRADFEFYLIMLLRPAFFVIIIELLKSKKLRMLSLPDVVVVSAFFW